MALSRTLLAAALACLPLSCLPLAAQAQQPERPDQTRFKAIYKELVEINTTASVGDCTAAARAMQAHLLSAGFPASDARVLVPEGSPRSGALAAVLHGTDTSQKAILLLAHLDVVEADPKDWTRDPFKLIEEGGYFYARGSSDDKAQAATFVDNLIRYRQEGFRPKRDIKLALTCGEEGGAWLNGVDYLLEHNRDVLDAAFAINEGAAGRLDESGKRINQGIQIGEKISQTFVLETTNVGGHSSRPVKDNAIYHIAAALKRIEAYSFPIEINATTRRYFALSAPLTPGAVGAAMKVLGSRTDARAAKVVADANPNWNAMMHTTCVATMLNAGHAVNALPQRARATVNCRILPGHTPREVMADINRIIADPQVKVSYNNDKEERPSPAPPLDPKVLGPAEAVTRKMWGDIPLIPNMLVAATDGLALNIAGIPTYGLQGIFVDPDGGGLHGLNERIRVRSLYEGRDFLYEVVKIYAAQD